VSKSNRGAPARNSGGQPDTHSLQDNVAQPTAGVNVDPPAPGKLLVTMTAADLTALIDSRLELFADTGSTLPKYIGRGELGQMLGVSPPVIRRLESEGLPCLRLGEVRRYSVDAVQSWLANRGRP